MPKTQTASKTGEQKISDEELAEIAAALRNTISIASVIVHEKLIVDNRTGKVLKRQVTYENLTTTEALAMAYCDTPEKKVFYLKQPKGV